ncbi:hypothetical protein DFH05DRAFT_1497768 [Lentinula detonsa]|uniref:Uncharacterized protein n=1 Tax=Lentinula detonsa TaxID=2804962 RepID=A0A9W8TXE0_9AGAR|nr:hypothetical protein DFH05DRAFT_1497768 [Lentinula detonsa]
MLFVFSIHVDIPGREPYCPLTILVTEYRCALGAFPCRYLEIPVATLSLPVLLLFVAHSLAVTHSVSGRHLLMVLRPIDLMRYRRSVLLLYVFLLLVRYLPTLASSLVSFPHIPPYFLRLPITRLAIQVVLGILLGSSMMVNHFLVIFDDLVAGIGPYQFGLGSFWWPLELSDGWLGFV